MSFRFKVHPLPRTLLSTPLHPSFVDRTGSPFDALKLQPLSLSHTLLCSAAALLCSCEQTGQRQQSRAHELTRRLLLSSSLTELSPLTRRASVLGIRIPNVHRIASHRWGSPLRLLECAALYLGTCLEPRSRFCSDVGAPWRQFGKLVCRNRCPLRIESALKKTRFLTVALPLPSSHGRWGSWRYAVGFEPQQIFKGNTLASQDF